MDDPTIDIKNIKYDFTNYMIKEINIIITPGNTFTVKYDEKTRIYDILSVNPGTSDPVTNVQLTNAPVTNAPVNTTEGKNTQIKTDQVNNDHSEDDNNSSQTKLDNKKNSLSTQTFINSRDLIDKINNLGFTYTPQSV